jgi:glycosyltransferase involved in cell wall biosynthesis
MRVKVLHVSQPGGGGVARVVAELAADQAERGYDVVVAGPAAGDLERWLARERVRFVEWRARRSPGPHAFLEARDLIRIISAERPGLVHLHSSKAGLAGRLALRGRLPTLFQPHSWSFEALRGPLRAAAAAWERRAASWTDTIVCVSEEERARGWSAGIRARFRVVPNGVDLDKFAAAGPTERAAARARLGLADGPLAVCVARLCRQKGQDLLVRGWPSVRSRVPEARLVLVGAGPDERDLRRAAGEAVELVGPRDDVRDWLAAADVFAAPSRWEGMSIAVLEAMASGRSVVATDVPGIHEALGEAADVVAVETVDALADAIAERLADPELAAEEGRAARERAERFHDVRTTHERIAEVYADVLDRRLRRKGAVESAEPRPAQ